MDGRAKRGESLAGKTIALAAVLVTLLAAGTLLSACAQQRTTSQFAVAQPAIPQKASENNPEAWLDALEQNPIDQSFVDSLAAFAYRSTASVLGDGADGAKANRMYSPLSLYYALALANEGAAGQTRDEIASVLGAPSTVDVPQQCGNLFRVLATDPFSTVDLANSIWMAKDASFEQSFIDTAIGQFYACLLYTSCRVARPRFSTSLPVAAMCRMWPKSWSYRRTPCGPTRRAFSRKWGFIRARSLSTWWSPSKREHVPAERELCIAKGSARPISHMSCSAEECFT